MEVDYTALIRRALYLAGYWDSPVTPESLRECFRDYVSAGVWRDLCVEDLEDEDEWSIEEMARGLIRYCK